MVLEKVAWIVTPAKAGVQNVLKKLDSGFRRNDKSCGVSTFYEFINSRRWKETCSEKIMKGV